MKYLLTAVLSLFICGFLYAQEEFSAPQGEEVTAVISVQTASPSAAEAETLSAARTVADVAPSAGTPAAAAGNAIDGVKTETKPKIVKEGETLEEFLKKQEELWLKEKGETPSVAVELSAPSVLSAGDNQPDLQQPQVQPSEQEPQQIQPQQNHPQANTAALSAKPAAQNKTVSVKSAKEPVKKAAKKEQSFTQKQDIAPEAAAEEETSPTPPAPAEKQNNWPAFFKGCIFTLILCAAVWLISKYQ